MLHAQVTGWWSQSHLVQQWWVNSSRWSFSESSLTIQHGLQYTAALKLIFGTKFFLTNSTVVYRTSPWPWPWFIPHPTGHIGPHSDAIHVCQELPPLLPPRWTPSFVGLCWLHPPVRSWSTLPTQSNISTRIACNYLHAHFRAQICWTLKKISQQLISRSAADIGWQQLTHLHCPSHRRR